MQTKVVRTLALALLLGGISMVMGQTPQNPPGVQGQEKAKKPPKRTVLAVEEDETPKTTAKKKRVEEEEESAKSKTPAKKSKLEEMLAVALKNNPDIRVATAKVAEADAELNRTRLQVTQKVVMLYHAIQTQKKLVELEETKYKRFHGLLAGRAIDSKLADEKQQELALAKAKLAELEAQIPALLGNTPQSDYEWTLQEAKLSRREVNRSSTSTIQTRRTMIADAEAEREILRKATGPMAERLRKALQTPLKVDYKNMAFDAILADLAKKVPGLLLRNWYSKYHTWRGDLRFEEALPVSTILQALADDAGCSFFVREYGILATTGENAPPGAMTVEEFLRQKPAKEPAVPHIPDSSSWLPWKPPENLEGTIKSITPNGDVEITFNSVEGLLDGHRFYVYRPANESSKAKELGMVQIFTFHPRQNNERMGRPVGQLTEPPKIGDKVALRLPSSNKNPPNANLEGRVKAVDASGLMTITLGSDEGLVKGHTLELFRLTEKVSESKYLGTVRVLEVEAHQSVAQPVGKLTAAPRSGDRVASRIPGK